MTIFGWQGRWGGRPARAGVFSLADIRPGGQAQIAGFSPTLSPDRQAHLQAYGLLPGRWVRVLQHAPVTVVRVEHTELAMEAELAGAIRVVRG